MQRNKPKVADISHQAGNGNYKNLQDEQQLTQKLNRKSGNERTNNNNILFGTIKLFGFAIASIGCVPQTFMVWVTWRILTFACPDWIFQIGDDVVFSIYQRILLFFYEHGHRMKVHLYGDAISIMSKKERVLYISNHQSTMDWVVAHMLAVRQGMLGQTRYVMKADLQKVPIYGFCFDQHGCVYVNRNNFNQNKMVRALNYLKNPKINSWLVLFPEGTRYIPQSTGLQNSQKFAEEQGLEPLNHLLTPRGRGMKLILDHLQSSFDAIYDTTIVYEGTKDQETGCRFKSPGLFGVLSGGCCGVHIHVNRIDMKSVPTDEKAMKTWLHNIFVKKDNLLAKYFSKGEENVFDGEKVLSPLSYWETVPALVFVSCLSYPVLAYSTGRSLYFPMWLLLSLGGYCWLGIRSVA